MTDGPGTESILVAENLAAHRFEISSDGRLAGFTRYSAVAPDLYEFFHTEIDPSVEGRGLGTQLISAAVDSVAARGISVLPTCPFVRAYLHKHPEKAGLVPLADRRRFGL
ncbi:N-acetyltransferase [Jatrophihabitans telluris]|uniref:N-acetyltransferase n=1 Tax=Jatrophihabitans telluris TaxID=2038343 RepID=A0ABY4QYN4_9ACTN|nr:GNAT family N-acetyltransferase [Jatrophihabitans telluris]UQX88615.1 N-acetyltransferase [Jatrophihabitans telluris]